MFYQVHIHQIRREAEGIHSFDLVPDSSCTSLTGEFRAGAFVTLELPNGLRRSYSLFEHVPKSNAYRIAIKHERKGMGASKWLHEAARVGQPLRMSTPQHDFALEESATSSVFI